MLPMSEITATLRSVSVLVWAPSSDAAIASASHTTVTAATSAQPRPGVREKTIDETRLSQQVIAGSPAGPTATAGRSLDVGEHQGRTARVSAMGTSRDQMGSRTSGAVEQ